MPPSLVTFRLITSHSALGDERHTSCKRAARSRRPRSRPAACACSSASPCQSAAAPAARSARCRSAPCARRRASSAWRSRLVGVERQRSRFGPTASRTAAMRATSSVGVAGELQLELRIAFVGQLRRLRRHLRRRLDRQDARLRDARRAVAPPSSTCTGTPSRRASRSCSAMSMPALAAGASASAMSTSSMIAAMSAPSRPISRGSRKSSAALVPSELRRDRRQRVAVAETDAAGVVGQDDGPAADVRERRAGKRPACVGLALHAWLCFGGDDGHARCPRRSFRRDYGDNDDESKPMGAAVACRDGRDRPRAGRHLSVAPGPFRRAVRRRRADRRGGAAVRGADAQAARPIGRHREPSRRRRDRRHRGGAQRPARRLHAAARRAGATVRHAERARGPLRRAEGPHPARGRSGARRRC